MLPAQPTEYHELYDPETQQLYKLRFPLRLVEQIRAGNPQPALEWARAKSAPLAETKRQLKETIDKLKRRRN